MYPFPRLWLYSSKVDISADKFSERYRGIGSDATVTQYRQGARSFDKYLEAHGRTVHNLHSGDMEDYVRWLITEKKKPSTVHNYVTIARLYCDWVRKTGVEVPEMPKPMLPRMRKVKMEILPEKLIPTYNAACIRYTDDPFMTALLLLPMTGLRVSEMCALEIGDVKISTPTAENPLATAQLSVLGKGDKYRKVPVLSEGIGILSKYLVNVRQGLGRSKWLFPASRSANKHISRHQLSGRLKRIKNRIGISKLHPHLLRHTYATILNAAGIDGFDLASILGHADIRVTSIYVHPLESKLLSDVSKLSYQGKEKTK